MKTKQASKYKRLPALIVLVLFIASVVAGLYYALDDGRSTTRAQADNPADLKAKSVAQLGQGALTFYDSTGKAKINIVVEIAQNEYTRARGLMHRKTLPETQGMLFIFDEEESRYFWMKNTSISLDMFFINNEHRIVHTEKYTKPYSQRSYPSVKPARYVVEVNAGFADRYDIVPGDSVAWRRF